MSWKFHSRALKKSASQKDTKKNKIIKSTPKPIMTGKQKVWHNQMFTFNFIRNFLKHSLQMLRLLIVNWDVLKSCNVLKPVKLLIR